MEAETTAARLARAVAEASDAWLADPRDVNVYERLVKATAAWKAYTYPVLPGTERVTGRRTPRTPLGPPPTPAAVREPDKDPGPTGPAPVSDVVAGEPQDVLARLTGRAQGTSEP